MPQPDGGESSVRFDAGFGHSAGPRLEALIALQPQKCSTYSAPSGVKAASSGISLQHTQQLVLGSLAFMVVFLHWLTKPTKAAAGIGLANGNPAPCRNPPAATTQGSRVFPHPRLPPPLSFSEDGCALNVRSRLHYSSGGLDPSGNDGLLPAISGRRRTFRNRPFDAAPPTFSTCV